MSNLIKTIFNERISLIFISICGIGFILWGINDIKKYYKCHYKKKLRFLSMKFTPPIIALSYAQILGGIMILLFVMIWVITYGIN